MMYIISRDFSDVEELKRVETKETVKSIQIDPSDIEKR